MGIVDGDVLILHIDAPTTQSGSSTSSPVVFRLYMDSDDEIEDPNSATAVAVPAEDSAAPVAVPDEGFADGGNPSASASAQDCQPGTSKGALQKEKKVELKKKSAPAPVKKTTSAQKKTGATNMLPSSDVYNQLPLRDQLTYLEYYKEHGFNKEQEEYLKNFNPSFAETVLKART